MKTYVRLAAGLIAAGFLVSCALEDAADGGFPSGAGEGGTAQGFGTVGEGGTQQGFPGGAGAGGTQQGSPGGGGSGGTKSGFEAVAGGGGGGLSGLCKPIADCYYQKHLELAGEGDGDMPTVEEYEKNLAMCECLGVFPEAVQFLTSSSLMADLKPPSCNDPLEIGQDKEYWAPILKKYYTAECDEAGEWEGDFRDCDFEPNSPEALAFEGCVDEVWESDAAAGGGFDE
ncbi:MAG: hypothetical protein FJ109_16650 [Deltaproteobacteria bacterium]|nr:hypothetical protein [Deltaproteobacteria bacterium]